MGCFVYKEGFGDGNLLLFKNSNIVTKALRWLFGDINIRIEPGMKAVLVSIGCATLWRILGKCAYHLQNMLTAVYVFIVERKRIKKIKFWKKVLYTITWPTFDIIYRYSMYAALFMKVTWKPIPHTSKVTIEDVDK